MARFYPFWSFRTANFTVTASAAYDDDLDLSFDETGEIERRLADCTLEAFQVRVTCRHNGTGLETSDTLGGCIYASRMEFRHQRGYFGDMVRTTLAAMRRVVSQASQIELRAAA